MMAAARRSMQGWTVHLFLPDYRPGKKRRSGQPDGSAMCGAASPRLAVTVAITRPLEGAERWCGPCLGRYAAHTGRLDDTARMLGLAAPRPASREVAP